MIAVSICDFELWPDAAQRAHGEAPVPMVSQWSMSERTNGARRGLGQVQYVFLELPKLGDRLPQTAAERWAVLFRSAPDLTPRSIEGVPLTEAQRHALEHAREELMTAQERDLIERSREEVDQVRRAVESALEQGALSGRRQALRALARSAGIVLTADEESRIDACDDGALLDRWVTNGRTASNARELFQT